MRVEKRTWGIVDGRWIRYVGQDEVRKGRLRRM